MKKYFLYLLLDKMRTNPNFKRKLKFLFIASVVGFVFLAGGMIWAGISVYRVAAQQVQAIQTSQPFKDLNVSVGTTSALITTNCWNKVQTYFSVEAWLTKPISENWDGIRGACFSTKAGSCEGEACNERDIKNNSDDGAAFI